MYCNGTQLSKLLLDFLLLYYCITLLKCWGTSSNSDEFKVVMVVTTYEEYGLLGRLRHYAASRKVAGSSPDEVDFLN
jgi:hypothetical protein